MSSRSSVGLIVVTFASLVAARLCATPPAELSAALQTFRTDGPKGWSYTQTSAGAGESRVERFDAAKPDFERWTLLRLNDRAPTADEDRDYREKQTRRSRGGTAPLLTDRLDLEAATLVTSTPESATYRCPLKPGEPGDDTARNLSAILVLDRPAQTITSLEIASVRPFSPTFGVHVDEMRTTMTYSLPSAGRPSLPQKVTTRVRGRAFLFKSLDADLVVTFGDYEKARRP